MFGRWHTRALRIAAFVAMAAALAGHANAQPDASKPLTLIVPFAAGGTSDVVARLLAQQASTGIGQPVVVDNRPGAGGSIAAAVVANAKPDGNTLLFIAAGHAGMGALYSGLAFDPIKSFAPVIGVAAAPIAVVVNANSRHRTLKDFVAYARANPGKFNCAGGGGGATVTNLALEVFKSELKLDIASIPYKGSAPAVTALLAGEIDCDFDTLSSVAGHVKAGKFIVLAVTSAKRSALLPEVPTVAETVLPEFSANAWFGVLAPKETPQPTIDRLHREFATALNAPQTRERLKELATESIAGSSAEFGRFLESEAARWGGVIRRLGLKPD